MAAAVVKGITKIADEGVEVGGRIAKGTKSVDITEALAKISKVDFSKYVKVAGGVAGGGVAAGLGIDALVQTLKKNSTTYMITNAYNDLNSGNRVLIEYSPPDKIGIRDSIIITSWNDNDSKVKMMSSFPVYKVVSDGKVILDNAIVIQNNTKGTMQIQTDFFKETGKTLGGVVQTAAGVATDVAGGTVQPVTGFINDLFKQLGIEDMKNIIIFLIGFWFIIQIKRLLF